MESPKIRGLQVRPNTPCLLLMHCKKICNALGGYPRGFGRGRKREQKHLHSNSEARAHLLPPPPINNRICAIIASPPSPSPSPPIWGEVPPLPYLIPPPPLYPGTTTTRLQEASHARKCPGCRERRRWWASSSSPPLPFVRQMQGRGCIR